ncbi:flagellar assembly protein FliW [Malaciobacter canalis]|uniref:flagellar assembly protein FliW n=1 Tax=Malaciobacter canalis TaxID=1912871 RepID=UPI0013FE1D23|nr:flagellar assembly protein FliW [Malaciobacter canalis]QEE33915.1 putative flagellin level sensor protein FliW [Malaciobacter canalis]
MYEVKVPILGFDKIKYMNIKRLDKDFSILQIDEKDNTNMHMISSNSIKSFDIEFDESFLKKMQINKDTKISFYFSIVINNPVANSVVNLTAPIVINEDKKLLGQYIIKKSTSFFTTMSELSI